MSAGFEATSLERRYAYLDDCPEHLLAQIVTLPLGSLAERAAGVRRWREALLGGVLPEGGDWPPAAVARPVFQALEELRLVRYCRGEPDLVDALIGDLLSALARQVEAFRSEVAERLRELEALERVQLSEREKARTGGKARPRGPIQLDAATLRRLGEQAEREMVDRDRDADSILVAAWGERVRAWALIAEVFGDLGNLLGRGWDMAPGVLRHTGWLDLVRLRALLKQLPQLREIVQALGRLHVADDGSSIAETILAPVRRLEEERREVVTPYVHAEARGVERSGEIARMLPLEAVMLGHPGLRLLWHARRAERALLTYRVEGVEIEPVWVEREAEEESEARRPRRERGPILVVIDTSGSMHGLPERVAKAIVLEAARTAHTEKRRCLLYTYGGPGEVLEHELDLAVEGIGRLLAFLGLSFGGGSDEAGVLTRVLARLGEEAWQNADVLFVSDGEWPAPTAVVAAVRQAADGGTRFHGVQIGNLGRTGLHGVCDPVHVFQDWAAAGGWR